MFVTIRQSNKHVQTIQATLSQVTYSVGQFTLFLFALYNFFFLFLSAVVLGVTS